MTHKMKLTSKRQATLPVGVCKELGVKAGDDIILEKQEIKGDMLWVLRTRKQDAPGWFGRLRRYARNKSHDMETIRSAIGARLGKEK